MKKFFAAMACLLASLPSHAADANKYAVVSLVGKTLQLSVFSPSTGSHVKGNHVENIKLSTEQLESTSLVAVGKALSKQQGKPDLLLLDDAELYQHQNSLFDKPAENEAVRAKLVKILQTSDAGHAILVTRHRADIEVPFADSTQTTGKIEGLGFYLDNQIRIENNRTREFDTGIIMPFAYLKLRLVDPQTLQVRKEVVVKEALIANKDQTEGSGLRVWETLSPEAKAALLDKLLRRGIEKAVPQLLATPAAAGT